MFMKKKVLGGWQNWVIPDGHFVIKKQKTLKESEDIIRPFFKRIHRTEQSVVKEAKRTRHDYFKSLSIVKKSGCPPNLLGYPHILRNHRIKEICVVPLGKKITHLYNQGKKKEAKNLIDAFMELSHQLWQYGIFEKTRKFYDNYGVYRNKVMLVDFLELEDEKRKIVASLKRSEWKKHLPNLEKRIPPEVALYFRKRVYEELNPKKFEAFWLANTKNLETKKHSNKIHRTR